MLCCGDQPLDAQQQHWATGPVLTACTLLRARTEPCCAVLRCDAQTSRLTSSSSVEPQPPVLPSPKPQRMRAGSNLVVDMLRPMQVSSCLAPGILPSRKSLRSTRRQPPGGRHPAAAGAAVAVFHCQYLSSSPSALLP